MGTGSVPRHQSGATSPRGGVFARLSFPWVVLLGSLLITAVSVAAIVTRGQARERARFERNAEDLRQQTMLHMATYIALLRGAAGYFASNPECTAEDFRAYVGSLNLRKAYPGIQGIGLTRRIAPGEVAAFERRMRAQGMPNFKVLPDTPRDEYFVLTYLEPRDQRNLAMMGFDMSTAPLRREAMERARDTGEPALSGEIRIVQEIEGPPEEGFLLIAPVYSFGPPPTTVAERRRRLLGFVSAPFRADGQLDAIFATPLGRRLGIQLYDGPVPDESKLLHDDRRAAGAIDDSPRLADTLPMDIAGRRWTMVVTPGQAFGVRPRDTLGAWVMILGVFISVATFMLLRSRRQAMARASRLRDLFNDVIEQAPVAISVTRGPQHIFQIANSRFREIAQQPEPIGLPAGDVLPAARERGLVAILDRVYATGTPWTAHAAEYAYDRRGSGTLEPGYFNIVFHPFFGGYDRPVGIIGVASEVTTEVEAQRDAELARREAEKANRAKSDFLAAMSHELRTPLNAITGYVQLMELGIHGPVTSEQLHALDRMRKSAAHLLSLINDVLNFAKLEAGRIEFEINPVSLRGAVDGVVHMVEPQLRSKGLELRVDVPGDITVSVDLEKLHQILLNLLSNAVKYTEQGGITVDVVMLEHDPEHVILRVVDTGIGIPEERLEAVFDPFVQVNRTRISNIEGTGLGLAISRDLARGMDSDITVRSTVGKGSEFSVILPRVLETERVVDRPAVERADRPEASG